MTASTSINILNIRLKLNTSATYCESAKDEEGVGWHTWWVEKNSCPEDQLLQMSPLVGIKFSSVHIDGDVVLEVCDEALMQIVKAAEIL